MLPNKDSFELTHANSEIVYGRGAVESLDKRLAERGLERGLIVCGSNVGANNQLMNQLQEGLGDRFLGVFDGTTPNKSIEDAYQGIKAIEKWDPDVLIGVGGGSSLDITRQMSVLEADGRSIDTIKQAAKNESLEPPKPQEEPIPVVVVPTTFAGATDSSGGSLIVLPADQSPTEQPIRIGGSIRPTAMLYDPDLFETTPLSVLAGSAMNGFNKGLETIYSSEANPFTDATASHGLQLFREGLLNLSNDEGGMDKCVAGLILVQFERNTNIIHAFGHGFARRYPVQQGAIHAIMAPHVLRYLFSKTDVRRHFLAQALDIDTKSLTEDSVGERIIEEVIKVRDGFDLPSKLSDLDPVRKQDFPEIARFIISDGPMARGPQSVHMSEAEIVDTLESAW